MRLIDADALIKDIESAGKSVMFTSYHEHMVHDDKIEFAIDAIEEAPTIEAEPVVHAHWEVRGGVPYCSACGEMLNGYSNDNDVSTTPRCSFCGAKMYGGENAEKDKS